MKTYKFNIDGRELSLRYDAGQGRLAQVLLDGESPKPSPEDMPRYAAVISLAILEHETAVMHDDETDIITLRGQKSRWANPADSMNERGSLLKNLLGW